MSRIGSIIKAPTKIKIGAVAQFGTRVINGAKSNAKRNKIPQVTAVKPVRPPAPTPAALSTKAVMVLAPKRAPKLTPTASTVMALPSPGNLPSLGLAMPALVAVPIKVPMESNNSTKVKEKIMVTRPMLMALPISNWKKAALLKSGTAIMEKLSGNWALPVAYAKMLVTTAPIMKEPCTLRPSRGL